MRIVNQHFWTLWVTAGLLMAVSVDAHARAGINGEGHPNYLCNDGNCDPVIVTATYAEKLAAQQETEINSYVGASFDSTWSGGAHSYDGMFSPVSVTASAQPKNSKSNGKKDSAGEPIEISTGTKYSSHTDFALPGEMGLKYIRYYRSHGGWTNNTDYSLDTDCGGVDNCFHVTLNRPDGSSVKFGGPPGTVGNYPERGGGGLATLAGNADGSYTLHDEDATTQTYDANGQLLSIKDASGIGWTLTHSYDGQTSTWTTRVTHTDGQSMTITKQNVLTNNLLTSTNTTVTDPAGNIYSGVENLTAPYGETVTLPGSPATVTIYDKAASAGKSETDINGVPYGYSTYINYDFGNGAYQTLENGTQMVDGSQATSITYAFPSGGQTSTITNALGHVSTNQYNEAHDLNGTYYYQLASVSDPAVVDGPSTTQTRSYDSNGNLTKTVDDDGVAHTYSYAVNGQLQSETEAYGTSVARKTDYVWDPNQQLNRLTSVTVEGLLETSYTYNAQNRVASIMRTNLAAVGTANQSLTTTYAYTLYGNGMVQTETVTAPSPNGTARVTTNYDTLDNVTSVVDGLGHTTTFTGYNALGQPGHITGPNGDVTDFTYDARGRIATKTTHPYSTPSNPAGTPLTWTYTYDGFGLLAQTSVNYAGGGTTTWTRNAYMQVTSVTHTDKDGTSTESFTYDANGDVTSDVVARGSDVGKSTSTVYDALGRVYQRKGANGQVLTYAYDGNGNVLSVTDALGHKTSYQYDALNRVTKMVDANGGTTQYAYDAGDHLTRVTDPRGLVTTYNYDGLGLLWSQTSPDTGTTTFSYDSYGRLASKKLSGGTNQTFTYDALNRLTGATADTFNQTWTYDNCTDGKGRLCSVADGNTTTAYSYSPEGWIQGRGFTVGGTTYSVGYSYDSLNRPSVVVYPDGNQAIYHYRDDAVSEVDLKVGSYNVPGVTNIIYRPMNAAMSSWTSYNGLVNTINYDSDLRPTSISVPGVQSLTFAYDTADRLTKLTNGIDNTQTQTLGYDALNRLTSVSSGAENESYTYDADGNRLSQNVNGVATTFSPSASSNRLLSRSSGGTAVGYDYDPEGDVVSYGDGTQPQMFYYTGFDRLNGTYIGGLSTHFDVNPEGQRLRKYTSSSNTYFAPDVGGTLLAEDNNGTWMDYVYLNGRVVEVMANGGVFSLHDDQTGRPQVMTQPNSTSIDWAAQNKPFDRTVTTNAWGSFNIGFPGQYFDQEDGLYYNGHRDYDPTLGRYIESDPIGLLGGINTYVYGLNNPISRIDPAGTDSAMFYTGPYQSGTGGSACADSGGGGGSAASIAAIIIATEIAGLGPEDPAADAAALAEYSAWADTTAAGAEFTNITTDVTADEAGATLESNGFSSAASSDGQATIYTNANGDTYVIRPSNSAPGGQAMDYYPSNGSPQVKINLGGGH